MSSTTTVSSGKGTEVTRNDFSFPISVDFIYPVGSSPFGFTVTTEQKYQSDENVSVGGHLRAFNSVTNTVKSTDVSPAASSQDYTSFDSDGNFYNCQIASANNTLTTSAQVVVRTSTRNRVPCGLVFSDPVRGPGLFWSFLASFSPRNPTEMGNRLELLRARMIAK